jgi:hypothetical protein
MDAFDRKSLPTVVPVSSEQLLGARAAHRELWEVWSLAETETQLALEDWQDADSAGKAEAFRRYSEALDREAGAAVALEVGLTLGARRAA